MEKNKTNNKKNTKKSDSPKDKKTTKKKSTVTTKKNTTKTTVENNKTDKQNNYKIIKLIIIFIIVLALLYILILTIRTSQSSNLNNKKNEEEYEGPLNYSTTMLKDCEEKCYTLIGTQYGEEVLAMTSKEVLIKASELREEPKQILKFEDAQHSLIQVSTYKDTIITLQEASSSLSIVIYNFSGEVTKTFNVLNDEKGKVFKISPTYSDYEAFKVSEKGTVSFVGTKQVSNDPNIYMDDKGNNINLCTQGANIKDDEIVSGIFKMTYLKENTYSDVKYASTKTTVKDVKACN